MKYYLTGGLDKPDNHPQGGRGQEQLRVVAQVGKVHGQLHAEILTHLVCREKQSIRFFYGKAFTLYLYTN